MRREKQQTAASRDIKGTQGAFDFAHEAGATVKVVAAIGRRPVPGSAPSSRGKRVERVQVPEQPPEVKPTSTQRKARPVQEHGAERQKVPVTAGRKARPAASTPDVSSPAVVVVASVAEPVAKGRQPRKVRPASVPAVNVQPISAIVQDTPRAAGDTTATPIPRKEKQTARPRVRQGTVETPAVPVAPIPQPDTQPQPPAEAKKRARRTVVVAKTDVKPAVPAEIVPVQADHIPAPSTDAPGVLTLQAPSQPVATVVTLAPPTWRYVGKREEADQLYRRRFGTEVVPEPTMIAGTWAYALPAIRRPLA